MNSFAAIVLAAGKSTRMRSSMPKALHPIAGRPMIQHVLYALEQAGASRVIVVVGHGADQVRSLLGDSVEYVEQTEQRGTGHAALMTESLLSEWDGPVLVVPGDAPMITADALSALLESHSTNAATLLTVQLGDPTGYGRVVRENSGIGVQQIVEEKDASPTQREITEVAVSIYVFDPAFLYPALNGLSPENAQGEYYLTDTIGIARSQQRIVGALAWPDAAVGRGVNTRVELAEIDAMMQARIIRAHMLAGVTVVDPASTRIEIGVKIGQDTTVHPFTILRGITDIGEHCEIGPGSRIEDASIGARTRVRDSWVVASEVGSDTTIGPFANIRPASTIGSHVKIGDFVEIKSSVIEDDVSAGHFAYLGDATVGENSNIGAGTITCNYDGVRKHKTNIGKRAFVGSNSTLVAPVTIGDGAYVAAGSTITDSVPDNALGIGRAHQAVKDGWASRHAKSLAQAGKDAPKNE